MRILRIVLLVVVIVIALAVVGGVIVFNKWTHSPLPQLDGEITVTGLQDTVQVIRDQWGIPQVYATNSHDLFFAQGYTQAQDRWWQMEFSRHIGAGRIEELTGKQKSVLNNDLFIRKFGWLQAAQRDAEALDDDSQALLQAFADGVNGYISSRDKSDLAMEYNLLGVTGINIKVEPWTIVDSLVWAKVMSDNLSGNWDQELIRSDLYKTLGQEMTDEWMRPYPFGDKPTIVWPEELPITDASKTTASTDAGIVGLNSSIASNFMDNNLTVAFGNGPGIGSNNWVVSGKLTKSGMPLLANDPHLGIQMPSIWYEIGLHCQPIGDACPYNVEGFALPATPGIVIGHNDRIAWGFTNVGPDVEDLYLIKVNPDNPLQYEWNGEWRDMTVRDEVIKFGNGKPDLTIQVRETHLGPIINDNELDDDGNPNGFNNTDPMAFHWTATAEIGTIFTAVELINRAANWADFRNAASYWDVPGQNFVYADVDGNIAYQTTGRIPIRAEGHTGLLPIDGSTDQYEWKGYIPFDDLPRILNPERGYIATANQAVVPEAYYEQLREKLGAQFGENSNYSISLEWDYGDRGQRIDNMLETTGPHDAETFKAIQGDDYGTNAAGMTPYLKDLDFGDAKYNDTRDTMMNWDFQFIMESRQAAIYAYFWMRLMDNLYNDQLGDATQAGGGGQSLWATLELAKEPDNAWWDDTRTADVTETRDDILIRSFKEAYDQLVKEQGTNTDDWNWGKVHTATFVSNPLGASGIDVIEDMVNRGPVAVNGGNGIVNATSWSASSGEFSVSSLPSMRFIADLSDLSFSQTMHTTGQSGHPYSPHYGDMIDPWRTIQFHPMLWTREQVNSNAVNTLTLKPG